MGVFARGRQVVCAWVAIALFAQLATAADPDEEGSAEPEAVEEASALTPREQARQIRDLIRGRLAPSVRVESLFKVDLRDSESEAQLIAFLENVANRSPSVTPKTEPPPEQAESDDLWRARAEFFSLPANRRLRILEAHQRKRSDSAAQTETLANRRKSLEEAQARIAAWKSAIAEDPGEDFDSLATVDLLSWAPVTDDGEREVFLRPDTTEAEMEKLDGAAVAANTRSAQLELYRLQRQFIERKAEDSEGKKSADPEAPAAEVTPTGPGDLAAVTAEKERALKAAQAAETADLRIVESERARLLGVKESIAEVGSKMEKTRAGIDAIGNSELEWSQRAQELEALSVLDGDKSPQADKLYDELVGEVSEVRRRLDGALAIGRKSSLPDFTTGQEQRPLPKREGFEEVRKLRAEVSGEIKAIKGRHEELERAEVDVLRDAMVGMNRSRLRFMEMLSPSKRSRLQGFAATGMDQAFREIEQIRLEVRYHLLGLPRFLKAKKDELMRSPFPVLGSLLRFILLILAFRWWRKRADSVIDSFRAPWLETEPPTFVSNTMSVGLWYLKQVRKPLEWLVFFSVLVGTIEELAAAKEIQYVRIIIQWTLLGGFVMRLVNAMATRTRKAADTDALRFRSFRLVGVTVVFLWMILALTEEAVGHGTLHNWVWTLCKVLVLPVLLLLVVWWRKEIVARAKSDTEPNSLVRWVASNPRGFKGLAAAGVEGGYFLLEGFYKYVWRQASTLAVTRKLLAYLFRKEVEKQAIEAAEDERFTRLEGELYEKFGPEESAEQIVDSHMGKEVERLRELVRADNNVVVAVVGEWGQGKSTVISRAIEGLEPGEVCRVTAQPGGFDFLLGQLAEALGLSKQAKEKEVLAQIAETPPKLICIDDAHRLVRPLIGGLTDMDRLIGFARQVGGITDWVIAVGRPSWHYLQRARGDRAVFDEVIDLKPWSEEELRELVANRCAAVGVDPSFEELTVPRQVEASELSDEERNRRDYFRILWDYSDGNPSVALHFWRESLCVREGDPRVLVRLFQSPPADSLDLLPMTLYFVIRAIVQLELAREKDIVRCTDLRSAEVADALRFARSRGYIEQNKDRVQIALPWFRALTRVLARHHLLAS